MLERPQKRLIEPITAAVSRQKRREPRRRPGRRTLRDEKGEAPLLQGVAEPIDDRVLLDHDAAVAHGALDGGAGDAADRLPDPEGTEDLPVDAHEREDDERRPVDAPPEARGEAQPEKLRRDAGGRRVV